MWFVLESERISRQQHNVEVEIRGVSGFLHLWQRNRAGFVSCAQGREAGCPGGALIMTLDILTSCSFRRAAPVQASCLWLNSADGLWAAQADKAGEGCRGPGEQDQGLK